MENKQISGTTITLAALAGFLVLSQGLYAAGLGDWVVTSLLAWPGAFLVQSFGWVSLYVPLLLGTLAFVSTQPVNRTVLTALLYSLLPFFTVAALVRSFDPTDSTLLVSQLTQWMGPTTPFFLVLVLVVEAFGGAALKLTTLPKLDPRTADDAAEPVVPPRAAAMEDVESPASPTAEVSPEETAEFVEGESEAVDPEAPLQVPVLKEWNSVRALKDDPYFEIPEEFVSNSPALAALNRTLANMPPEEATAEDIDESSFVDVDMHEFDATPPPEVYEDEAGYSDYVEAVVDWDSLVLAGTATAHTELEAYEPADLEAELEADLELDEDELELEAEMEADAEAAIQVLAQPSALIRPLEGGNFPSKVVYVREKKTPVPFESAPEVAIGGDRLEDDELDAEADLVDPTLREPMSVPQAAEPGHWAQRPKFQQWHVPIEGLLTAYKQGNFSEIDDATKRAGHILQMTLKEFNIEAQVTGIRKGPVVTMFEILPAAGVKLSKIVALADNIALGLAATSVRIVAPIPGKHAVGIEVPNKERTLVGFAEMVASREFQESTAAIPIVIGKDISGDTQIIDLTRTPHLLIAGATGAGKSVSVNTLVCSILYKKSPDEVKLLMVDPKIVELKFFNDIPHLLAPVITDPKKALQAIQWCLYEMERRYALLDAIGAKDIKSYNSKIEKRHIATNRLPYIVLVIDEFADLMATSGKDLEGTIARLAAMSRAVGIHLVLATQRPSVDVITGLIKANFPSRIAFQVASKTDSRIIIDQMGAEKLLGRGDMLFTSSWNPFPSRVQGAFLSEDDVERVVAHVKTLGEPEYISDEIFFDEDAEEEAMSGLGDAEEMDPLFDKAVEIVRTFKKASASFLQRRLGVGYNRAARMVELMEEMGIVGPQQGSKPREIVHS